MEARLKKVGIGKLGEVSQTVPDAQVVAELAFGVRQVGRNQRAGLGHGDTLGDIDKALNARELTTDELARTVADMTTDDTVMVTVDKGPQTSAVLGRLRVLTKRSDNPIETRRAASGTNREGEEKELILIRRK